MKSRSRSRRCACANLSARCGFQKSWRCFEMAASKSSGRAARARAKGSAMRRSTRPAASSRAGVKVYLAPRACSGCNELDAWIDRRDAHRQWAKSASGGSSYGGGVDTLGTTFARGARFNLWNRADRQRKRARSHGFARSRMHHRKTGADACAQTTYGSFPVSSRSGLRSGRGRFVQSLSGREKKICAIPPSPRRSRARQVSLKWPSGKNPPISSPPIGGYLAAVCSGGDFPPRERAEPAIVKRRRMTRNGRGPRFSSNVKKSNCVAGSE